MRRARVIVSRCSASPKTSSIAGENAFSRSGRLSVSQTTPSSNVSGRSGIAVLFGSTRHCADRLLTRPREALHVLLQARQRRRTAGRDTRTMGHVVAAAGLPDGIDLLL